MWALSSIIQAACSDDETDDGSSVKRDATTRSQRLSLVRRLTWRSEKLEAVCTRLDAYRSKVNSSIPGTSPGQRGRRPRTRIRREIDDRPLSRIEAPVGLPIDCYSEEWLAGISAVEWCELRVHSKPVLESMTSLLDSVI